MNRPDRELRTIKRLFYVILILLLLAIGAFVWYASTHPVTSINNIQYVSREPKQGLSAYDVAVKNGFNGTEIQWLTSLQGKDGTTKVVTEVVHTTVEVPVAGKNGKDGKDGVDGQSAYDLWISIGNVGTVEDFIRSLSPEPTADKVTEVRFNQLTQNYETRLTGDVFWKVVPSCGLVRVCK